LAKEIFPGIKKESSGICKIYKKRSNSIEALILVSYSF